MISKLPERGKESNINWIFASNNAPDKSISVDLLKFAPTIPDVAYRKKTTYISIINYYK